MDINDFKEKKKLIDKLATKYDWQSAPCDSSVGRISYNDEFNIYRIDIYTSKMTVCILPKGTNPVYKKKQNIQMIGEIFRNPFIY